MEDNAILIKSKAFAIRIVRMYKWLAQEQHEFVLSKQCLRSGTSIGANVHEGMMARSKAEFIAKLQISVIEAHETKYWLELLYETEYLDKKEYFSLKNDCDEIKRILSATTKTMNKKLADNNK